MQRNIPVSYNGKVQKHLLLLTLWTVLLVLTFTTFKVHACFPGPPNPWYNTTLTFDKNTLPSGIEIVQTDPVYEPYALINKNPEPLYLVREINPVLLSEAYGDEYRYPTSGLPEGYEPHFKITPEQVYVWGQFGSEDAIGWKKNNIGINDSAATRVRIDGGVYVLNGDSRQVYEDARPTNVSIPDPQTFSILAYYQNQPITIKGTLNYSLNKNYDPRAGAKGANACAILSSIPTFMALAVFSLIIFIIIKLLKGWKK